MHRLLGMWLSHGLIQVDTRKRLTMRESNLLTVVLVTTMYLAVAPSLALGAEPATGPARAYTERQSGVSQRSITFSGAASGGTLIFLQSPTLNANSYVRIETTPGEAPESVAGRLAEAFASLPEPIWMGGSPVAEGATIGPIPGSLDGRYAFAGTETGLGIPPAPKSVTGNYEPDTSKIVLRWVNPPGNYDRIGIMLGGLGCSTSGDATSYRFSAHSSLVRGSRDEDLKSCVVVGYRKGVPSAPAGIHVMGRIQEEAIGIPFVGGAAPNWTAWATDSTAPKLEENKRPEKMKGKLFYQRVKSKKPGEQVGVWRKFLGLVPGHTYKISAWVCTGAMDDSQGDWSFSLHAVPDAPDGKDFTADQFAGRAALPAGARGPQAGAFAAYRRGVTTARKEFARASTDSADNSPGREIGHITQPPDVTSITVWVRYTSADPNASGVAFDHLRLEDLTQAR
jgi:hypothetical protein